MKLNLLPYHLAVWRLPPFSPIPVMVLDLPFFSVTQTQDELSIVLPEEFAGSDGKAEKGWRVLQIIGPLDFNLVGILAEISNILAGANIPIFAISTYDTDYILVKQADLTAALEVLSIHGHSIDIPSKM